MLALVIVLVGGGATLAKHEHTGKHQSVAHIALPLQPDHGGSLAEGHAAQAVQSGARPQDTRAQRKGSDVDAARQSDGRDVLRAEHAHPVLVHGGRAAPRRLGHLHGPATLECEEGRDARGLGAHDERLRGPRRHSPPGAS